MRLAVVSFILSFGLCLAGHAEEFQHSMTGPAVPWTEKQIPSLDDRLTFVIHADLTGGERPEIFATAIGQVKLLQPEFMISVGDLIEGGGDRQALNAEWDSYDARVADLDFPVFYVGGNHDLSSTQERAVWAERLGPTWYHFRFKDVLFLVLDSEDMTAERREIIASQRADAVETYKSEGPEAFAKTAYASSPERTSGAISQAQADEIVAAISANTDVRHTFLFVHKPVWQTETETPFDQIEAALSDRTYTVFNGHVQAYAYERRNNRDYVQLATTGGEQFPDVGLSEDHITLVTVSGSEVSIANLMLAGIRDKTGLIPQNGDQLCFATAECGDEN